MEVGVIKLPEDFIGKGEVKGFQFHQLKRGNNAFLYEVMTEGRSHYEVFKFRVVFTPKTKIPHEGYPKANSFGIWAWTYNQLEKALVKFYTIENHE